MTVTPPSRRHHRAEAFLASVLVTAVAVLGLADPGHAASPLSVGDPVLQLQFEDNVGDSAPEPHVTALTTPSGAEGTVTYVDGVDGGKAVKFGPNTYLDLGSRVDLQPGALSLSLWLKPDAAMSGEEVISWNKRAYNSDGWYLSSESGSVPLALSVGPAEGQPYKLRVSSGDRNAFFPPGEWTHIAVTYSSATKQAVFYRNGLRVPSQVASAPGGTATGVITGSEALPKTIGFNGPQYNGSFLKAALDEYQLFEGVATQRDIALLYADGGGDLDEEALAREDADDLSLPATATADLPLPGVGGNGSDITWESSDPEVVSTSGAVTRPAEGEDDVTVTLTARVRFVDGPTITREFDVEVQAEREVLDDSGLGVAMDDAYLRNGLEKEHDYLLSLSSDKFLYWWYRTAGLTPPTAEGYGGWENGNTGNNFRGHAFGHYLSGLAISYANTTDAEDKAAMLEQLTDGVSGLAEVQDSYAGQPDAYAGTADGYIAPFRTKAFSNIEGRGAGDPAAADPVIVPYYNIHKVLQGLLDVNRYVAGPAGQTALQVAEEFGRYLGRRMNTLADKSQMRGTEYGGMNEALYDLYERVGGDPLILDAAEAFDEVSLFTTVANGGDPLPGRHANTTIPKFIGALKRYTVFTQNPELFAQLTPQEQAELPLYYNAAEAFWRVVVEGHTYANGSNSQSEHFHEADTLYHYATQMGTTGNPQTSETCNVFNMLKLTRELFKLTQDVKYADYYENAFTNHIVSAQDPATGMTTYFQPMAPGYYKLYSMPFTDFWCCVGSSMESFSKYADSIYFSGADGPWVTMFWSSRYDHEPTGMRVATDADLPNDDTVTVTVSAMEGRQIADDAKLRLRVPDWVDGEVSLAVNGSAVSPTIDDGFVVLTGLEDGDVVRYSMPMHVQYVETADNPDFFVLKYGPVLLSAALDDAPIDRTTERNPVGIGVRVPTHREGLQEIVTVDADSVEAWQSDPTNVEQVEDTADGQVQFKLNGTLDAGDLRFTPHYRQHTSRYGLYLSYETADSESAQERIRAAKRVQRDREMVIDQLTTFNTNEQAEGAYHLQKGGTTNAGSFNGATYRDGNGAGSWFSYDFPVESADDIVQARYYGGDRGRSFRVLVDGVPTVETIENRNEDGRGFYWETYDVPDGAADDGEVTIRFESTGGLVGGVFGVRTSRGAAYDTDPTMQALTASPGALSPAFDPATAAYTLTVPEGTAEVALDADPHVASGLVEVDGVLIDDARPRTVELAADGPTVVEIEAFAQDHQTSTRYTVTIEESGAEPEPPAETSVVAQRTRMTYGRPLALPVRVRGATSGVVSAAVGGRTVSRRVDSAGRATLLLPARSLQPGARSVRVRYQGTDEFAPSSTVARVSVARAGSRVATAATRVIERGRTYVVRVAVSATGARPTGKVRLAVAGIGAEPVAAALRNGRATVRIPVARGAQPGTKKVRVTYLGNRLVAPRSVLRTVRVVR